MNEREINQSREIDKERANVVETNKYLVMTFKNTDGKNTSISLKYIKDPLTKAEVDACMQAIVANDIFFTTGGDLVAPVKAQIINKETTTLG